MITLIGPVDHALSILVWAHIWHRPGDSDFVLDAFGNTDKHNLNYCSSLQIVYLWMTAKNNIAAAARFLGQDFSSWGILGLPVPSVIRWNGAHNRTQDNDVILNLVWEGARVDPKSKGQLSHFIKKNHWNLQRVFIACLLAELQALLDAFASLVVAGVVVGAQGDSESFMMILATLTKQIAICCQFLQIHYFWVSTQNIIVAVVRSLGQYLLSFRILGVPVPSVSFNSGVKAQKQYADIFLHLVRGPRRPWFRGQVPHFIFKISRSQNLLQLITGMRTGSCGNIGCLFRKRKSKVLLCIVRIFGSHVLHTRGLPRWCAIFHHVEHKYRCDDVGIRPPL